MKAKEKFKKPVLIPDEYEDHESIKAASLDVKKKIIFTSIKHYLKCFKKNPEAIQLAPVIKLIEKLAEAYDIDLPDQIPPEALNRFEFKKNIIKLVDKKGRVK